MALSARWLLGLDQIIESLKSLEFYGKQGEKETLFDKVAYVPKQRVNPKTAMKPFEPLKDKDPGPGI